MEKTFREVIKEIKPGEVWENGCGKIECTDDTITIVSNYKFYTDVLKISEENLYTLERKEYTFEEAFKAYEEGKEIESIIDKVKFKKKDDAQFFYKFEQMEKWDIMDEDISIFSIDAIRDKWYIND